MASRDAVGRALALLGATFPRDITPELVAVWLEVFRDVPDDDLGRATTKALAACKFFPVPAELRGFSDYHPAYGTTPPSVEFVRSSFGDAIGEAYGLAGGGTRLFSGNETTAAIARRDFDTALAAAVRDGGAVDLPALPALTSGRESPGAVVFGSGGTRGGGLKRIGA
jgi:hypothetical protein